MCRRFCTVLFLLVVGSAVCGPPVRAGTTPVTYRAPVDAPVVDPFRAPAGPYAPGNRGLEYSTTPFTPVVAAAGGTVLFAGAVAGTLHVTVLHGDGLRTSYSFLAAVTVHPGAIVAEGEVLGFSGERLHVGVRDAAGTYLDPALLFDRPVAVALAPGGDDGTSVGLAAGAALERRSATELVTRWATELDGGTGESLLARARLWAHYGLEATPGAWRRRVVDRLTRERVRSDAPACTPASRTPPAPASRRILVLVGGFGTTSESSSVDRLDTSALGYAAGDVVRFSYAGGRVPDADVDRGPLAGLPASTYTTVDSQQDLLLAGQRLRALLADIAARQPGVPVDVVAHSQGGVVTHVALVGDGPTRLPEELDTVVTLGSPHDGTDLATALQAVRSTPRGADGLQAARDVLGVTLDPASPAARQLAETSDLQMMLAARPLPAGVDVTTIGARGDLTVPSVHTGLPGASHAVVDLMGRSAHSDLPAAPATTREVALALADLPPTCEGRGDHLADLAVGEAISWAEDVAGGTAAAAGVGWTITLGP